LKDAKTNTLGWVTAICTIAAFVNMERLTSCYGNAMIMLTPRDIFGGMLTGKDRGNSFIDLLCKGILGENFYQGRVSITKMVSRVITALKTWNSGYLGNLTAHGLRIWLSMHEQSLRDMVEYIGKYLMKVVQGVTDG